MTKRPSAMKRPERNHAAQMSAAATGVKQAPSITEATPRRHHGA